MIVSLPRRSFQPIEPHAELRGKVHVHQPSMPSKPYVMQDIMGCHAKINHVAGGSNNAWRCPCPWPTPGRARLRATAYITSSVRAHTTRPASPGKRAPDGRGHWLNTQMTAASDWVNPRSLCRHTHPPRVSMATDSQPTNLRCAPRKAIALGALANRGAPLAYQRQFRDDLTGSRTLAASRRCRARLLAVCSDAAVPGISGRHSSARRLRIRTAVTLSHRRRGTAPQHPLLSSLDSQSASTGSSPWRRTTSQ